ncbi:Dicer-like protein 1 [Microbotryomycetes sp. JL221]|nr:Dicer-like protein 1 [Microbotryomycetes sp. JL221]
MTEYNSVLPRRTRVSIACHSQLLSMVTTANSKTAKRLACSLAIDFLNKNENFFKVFCDCFQIRALKNQEQIQVETHVRVQDETVDTNAQDQNEETLDEMDSTDIDRGHTHTSNNTIFEREIVNHENEIDSTQDVVDLGSKVTSDSSMNVDVLSTVVQDEQTEIVDVEDGACGVEDHETTTNDDVTMLEHTLDNNS